MQPLSGIDSLVSVIQTFSDSEPLTRTAVLINQCAKGKTRLNPLPTDTARIDPLSITASSFEMRLPKMAVEHAQASLETMEPTRSVG